MCEEALSPDSYLKARQCLGLQVLVPLFLDCLVDLGALEIHQEEQVHSVLTHHITIIKRFNRSHSLLSGQKYKGSYSITNDPQEITHLWSTTL